jgi:uncharacterized protein (TIGR04255 family)
VSEDIKYNKNFLTDVIARVDFPYPVDAINAKLSTDLMNAIKKSFPSLEPKKGIANELKISNEKVEQKKTEFTEWRFFSEDRKSNLVIIPAAIFVEFKAYESFNNLKGLWCINRKTGSE